MRAAGPVAADRRRSIRTARRDLEQRSPRMNRNGRCCPDRLATPGINSIAPPIPGEKSPWFWQDFVPVEAIRHQDRAAPYTNGSFGGTLLLLITGLTGRFGPLASGGRGRRKGRILLKNPATQKSSRKIGTLLSACTVSQTWFPNGRFSGRNSGDQAISGEEPSSSTESAESCRSPSLQIRMSNQKKADARSCGLFFFAVQMRRKSAVSPQETQYLFAACARRM
jgi:hypothetical protein